MNYQQAVSTAARKRREGFCEVAVVRNYYHPHEWEVVYSSMIANFCISAFSKRKDK